MIQYLHKKYITNLSLIFNISIVQCTQTNQSIINHFEDQRYQSFKTKNVDSKYEQDVSCTVKRDEKKNMLISIQNIQGKWNVKRKKKEYQKCYHEREKGNMKNGIKETRKNKYKSQTKQCNDIVNRQKRNCKKNSCPKKN